MGDTQKLSPDQQIRFAREQFEAAEDFTVAVEEEFAVLDPTTLSLTNRFEELQAASNCSRAKRICSSGLSFWVSPMGRLH
jgi:hypothetical protein